MPAITLAAEVRLRDDVIFREIDGESVLLQLGDGVYFGLDTVGTRLWQLMDAHGTLTAVLEAALREFDADPGVLERDLLELVRQLAEKRLVRVS